MRERIEHLHGIAAEFLTAHSLENAARQALAAGFKRIEAYSPFAIDSLCEILGHSNRPIAACALIGGITGAVAGFGMCWYAFAIYYPLNIGGRPHNSWPAWIPITFEMAVLFAALSAVIGMLVANGLPRLHHPMFAVPGFERASRDRFFLCIDAADPRFNAGEIQALFTSVGALRISEVRE